MDSSFESEASIIYSPDDDIIHRWYRKLSNIFCEIIIYTAGSNIVARAVLNEDTR